MTEDTKGKNFKCVAMYTLFIVSKEVSNNCLNIVAYIFCYQIVCLQAI